MAVVETLRGLGSWGLSLSPGTPKSTLDALKFFGHIVIHTGRLNIAHGDALLRSGRYTGVYVGRDNGSDSYSLSGQGMALWLGDSEDKGDILEAAVTFSATTFQNTIRALLPNAGVGGAVAEGTIYNLAQNFTGSFQYSTRRKAIDYVCQTLGAVWRVNGDATLDAGLPSDLYTIVPKVYVLRRRSGQEMFARALAGDMSTAQDVDDFTSRVLLLAQGEQAATVTAAKDILVNPFKDIRGNPIKRTRIVSESTTDATNADARAQLQLNRFSGSRDAISLSTAEYDVTGDVEVGDYINVYDPEIGIINSSNEAYFNGEVLYPMSLQLTEINWPVSGGMSAAFRDNDGVWYDLTDYLVPEGGSTTLTVGGYNRSIVGPADGGPAGTRPIADTSVPGVPAWVQPFRDSVYQSDAGTNRTQVELAWTRPNNVDGTNILDGDHYDIRFRNSSTPLFPVTHAQMEAFTHAQLEAGTHEMPIVYTPGEWQYVTVPFDVLKVMLADLPTNMPYEAQIRAVDSATPANTGAWSTSAVFQTAADTLPPAVPAPPSIAASTLAVQMTHNLGRSDGGTFNLDPDLHHLELHGEYTPLFTPSTSTMLGRFSATYGMIKSHTPVVGTAQVDSVLPVYFKVIAVDEAGNASNPSTAVQATALLVDDAHISNLTVSKVTAGTITADWLVGAKIISGDPSAGRVQMVPGGFEAYNPSNVRTVFVEAATGEATITGTFQSGVAGRRVIINPSATKVPEIWFESTAGSVRHAYINSLGGSGDIWLGLNSGPTSDDGVSGTGFQTTIILTPTFGLFSRNVIGGGTGPYSSRNGGWFDTSSTEAAMGWNDDSTSTEWRYKIDSNGSHSLRGRYQQFVSDGGLSALYVDLFFGSGTNATYNYGATFATPPIPFLEIMPTSGGATGKYHCVSAKSTTSFSVEYPAGNCEVWIWAVRYG